MPPPAKPSAEETAAERERLFNEAKAAIAGRENEPAGKVYKDITILDDVTAGVLLGIMNTGFSKALGVSCTHCHTPGEWDRNDKRPKEAAREMVRFSQKINYELLPQLKNLANEKRGINCTTCHRGEVKPSQSLTPR